MQVDALFLGQILNNIELCAKDLVLHCRTVKKMCIYLDMLYSGGNNLSQAYEVIQELLRSKQESQMLAQFYANFNKLFEKIKEIFFYHS